MRITIISAGSRGDVQPYVALGKGLKTAGHSICMLAAEDFRSLITVHGLEFFDLGGSMVEITQSMQGLLEKGNMLKILASMGPTAKQMAMQAVTAGLEACRGADMVVAGLGGFFVGLSLAEKLGLPFVPAFLYPLTPTREFPGVLAPQGRIPTWANRLSHQVVQQMMWQTFRAADNKVRREMLGLVPLPMLGPFPSIEKKKQTILYGYSPFVIPVPKDWGDHNHVTGYWLLEPSSNWEAPADLLEFLESGPPPVYIGFGSMVHRSPEETTEMVLHALQRSGQRGLVSTGCVYGWFLAAYLAVPPDGSRGAPRRGGYNSGWSLGWDTVSHHTLFWRPTVLGTEGVRTRRGSTTHPTQAPDRGSADGSHPMCRVRCWDARRGCPAGAKHPR
jgi:sterol 3beta-glucosyltransferase